MNTLECSNRHFTRILRDNTSRALTKHTSNETQFHEIDEKVKISERLLHSRVIYIFASLRIKRSVSLRGDSFLIRREKRFIHVYTFATMNMMITSHRR